MPFYSGLRFRLMALMATLLLVTVTVLYELNRRSEQLIREQVSGYLTELTAAIEIGLKSINSADYLEDLRQRHLPEDRYHRVKHLMITDPKGLVTDAANRSEVGRRIRLPAPDSSLMVASDVLEDEDPHPEESKRAVFIPFYVASTDMKPEINYVVVVLSSRSLDEILAQTSRTRLLATMVVLTVGLVISLELVWRFTTPLKLLMRASERVAAGDLNFHIGLARRDEIGQLVVQFDDMVAQLRDKQALEERLNQAERAAVIGRLASGIAHEIRNPLNFMNLTVDHVRTRFAPAEEISARMFDHLLLSVKEEIARLNSLVTNVLRYGRPTRLMRKPARLADLLEAVIRVVRNLAEEQGVELCLTDETDGSEISMDVELMNSCFSNLALNAVQAMPTGGTLRMVIRRIQAGQAVTVSDTGTGIPPDALDRIFEPYFTTKETGIGLGLAVTRKFIEEHQGRISVTSVMGDGTTFTVWLPTHHQ